jgi:hypothetical protein
MEGKTQRGASSPAKPALHIPEPLSTTKQADSESAIVKELRAKRSVGEGREKVSYCQQRTTQTHIGALRWLHPISERPLETIFVVKYATSSRTFEPLMRVRDGGHIRVLRE